MATEKVIVQLDPRQMEDLKDFVRRENGRQLGLTQALADIALSLAGWTEITLPGEATRTFMPSDRATEDHPAAELARLRRRLRRLDDDLAARTGPAISVELVRGQIQDILK